MSPLEQMVTGDAWEFSAAIHQAMDKKKAIRNWLIQFHPDVMALGK